MIFSWRHLSGKEDAAGVNTAEICGVHVAHGFREIGDIVTAFDGRALTVYEQLREYLYECNVGDTVVLEYVRDGKKASAEVILGAAE